MDSDNFRKISFKEAFYVCGIYKISVCKLTFLIHFNKLTPSVLTREMLLLNVSRRNGSFCSINFSLYRTK